MKSNPGLRVEMLLIVDIECFDPAGVFEFDLPLNDPGEKRRSGCGAAGLGLKKPDSFELTAASLRMC